MTKIEKLENNKVKITVTVPAEAFAKSIEIACRKNAGRYNVPGFRKGKAPRRMIEQMYGESVFYEDAFELCWGDAYDAALAEHALIAVDKPEIEIETIGAGEDLVFTAGVQLKPDVTLGQYKGIGIPAQEYTVEDAEVDGALEAEREKQARFVDSDRTEVKDGDRITLDYSGSVGGVKFDGGTGEDQTLHIGSGTFIPGFEEQLVGKAVGEDCDVTVTFPAEYHADELAGKAAVFACKVKAISEKQLPELDDEFIKDISEFDSVAEWKAKKREELEGQKSERAKAARENAALKAACENASVEIPDCMVERQVDYMLRDLAYRLQSSGLSLQDYMGYMGMDAEKLKESYRA
ncbi:MAG: trigger factor, partial [Clostridiales bacterium]|nr:trigger factor [Clostridiales bacterium]